MFLAKTEQIAVVPLRTQLFVHMVTIAKTAMSEAKLWSRVVRGKNSLGVLLYGLVMSYEGRRKHIPPLGKGKCPNSNSKNLGRADVIVFIGGYKTWSSSPWWLAYKSTFPLVSEQWTDFWNCEVLWPQHGVHDLRHDEYHYGVSVNFYRFHDAWESKRLIFQPFPGGSWSLGWCSRSFLFGLPIPKQPEPGKQPHRLSQQQPITRPCLWMRLCLAWNTTMCLGEFGDSDKYTKGADFRLVKGGENLQMPTVEHHPYKFDLFVTSNLQYVIWMCV